MMGRRDTIEPCAGPAVGPRRKLSLQGAQVEVLAPSRAGAAAPMLSEPLVRS